MGQTNEVARPAHQPERKYRRFSLRYPVHVKFLRESSTREVQASTKNVSVGGLLLEAAAAIPQHCPVSFVMTIKGRGVVRPVKLMGSGEVVRVEPTSGTEFAIAVQCKHPIAQAEEHLVASDV
jgi:hypothetical protein